MEKADFLFKKYELIYDLFKVHVDFLKRRAQIFIAIHGGLFYVFSYSTKVGNFFLSDVIAFASFFVTLMWFVLNKKTLLFSELRKEHMREIEKEMESEGFTFDIFNIDRKVFGPGQGESHTWKATGEKFPPEKLLDDYRKFGRKPSSTYEKWLPIILMGSWILLFFYALWHLIINWSISLGHISSQLLVLPSSPSSEFFFAYGGQILAAILFFAGTVFLAFSQEPYNPQYKGEYYMPYKTIQWRFRLGILLNFLGFLLVVISNLANKFFQ